MCDFKPGDEVVCIYPGPWNSKRGRLYALWLELTNRVPLKGGTYTISFVGLGDGDVVGIDLRECPAPKSPRRMLWNADSFRKVQRRDLSEWLKTSIGNTDRLDKRKKEKA